MRNLFYILFLISCGLAKSQGKAPLKQNTEIVLGKETVKFDEIVYYKINKSFNTYNLKYKKDYSPKKKLVYEIVKGNTPRTMSDTLFVKNLERLNYYKENLTIPQYQKIAEIYSRGSGNYDTSCGKTFRDILVFKKNNKIIGVSKICFDCGWETTVFNENRYYNLIDIAFFEELENILNSKINSN